MEKNVHIVRLVIFFLIISSTGYVAYFQSVCFAETLKIGVIDYRKIYRSTPLGRSAQAKVENTKKAFQDQLKKSRNDIEKFKEELTAQASIIYGDALSERQRKLRIMINDYKEMQHKKSIGLEQIARETNLLLSKELEKRAQQIGKQHGLHIVLEKQQAGLLYVAEQIDLTDEVIALLIELNISY